MKPRHKRAALIVGALATIGIAAYFVLNAFQSNLVFFFTPSQVESGEAPKNRTFRVGGMVKTGSVHRDNLTVSFIVTDTLKEVPVTYTGILPDLFREGKGVVAQGQIKGDGKFTADEVLAKHDENYMPPEAQHAMDQAALEKASKTLK
ncbi:MAG: cytochrome c maturation protein CcmE [Rhodoferax sp.]|nr:cytochrome c maturation protein CcmE [Betaproteobacteria bacterium]NCN96342.1 cytochrome c maturation protein CcmE [Rhodoferax sp.]OIP13142.1 MAG: cytochrome c biogenesis protein CcmE [Comamonadaceae bacterium CG2_30_57_122]PIZ21433.1 MAG: cytochrome c maturation protein CcmE [Comamonadaceae bacterium CG_4_10_14_0_8_um_filter_57_29]PJC22269.1 MAG: cytochrome c maturation protein CcmE [Comamonadaceae bacterium CG_4_9_14_0_8_um_filter_57_21]